MALIKPVKGYEGLYLISDDGTVYSLPRVVFNGRGFYETPMKKLKAGTRAGKYKFVVLRKDGEERPFSIHRLVAEAFLENPNHYDEVNHKDENPANNAVDNLEWCTRQYNIDYSKSKSVAQFENGIEIAEYKSVAYASRITGIKRTAIDNALNGRSKSAGGYYWAYIERSNEKC